MQAVKAVMQNYRPTEEILSLLEDFRCMVNDCVRIGLKENPTSMKSLSMKAYHQLSAYDVPTCYRLTAVSRAAGILRNYRKELPKGVEEEESECDGSLRHQALAHGLLRVPGHPSPPEATD